MNIWVTKLERFDYDRHRWVPVNAEEIKPTMIESYLEVEKGRAFWRTLVGSAPMTEHALQCQVAEYLDAVLDPSVWWTSVGHGGGGVIRGAKLKRAGLKRGVPDVLICWTPVPWRPHIGWIELKTKTGRASDPQQLVARQLSALGHHYALCRSLDEVIGTLKAWGVGTREAKQVAA